MLIAANTEMLANLCAQVSILAFSLSGWHDLWQGFTVVSLACAFAAGLGTHLTGKWMAKEQASENIRQAKEILQLREKAATAEMRLLEFQKLINEPRMVDIKRAEGILALGPTNGSIEIKFLTNSDEPGELAKELAEVFSNHGWSVLSMDSVAILGGVPPGVRMVIYGLDREKLPFLPEDTPETAKTLYRVLAEAIIGNPDVEVLATPDVPQDALRIIIGPKY